MAYKRQIERELLFKDWEIVEIAYATAWWNDEN